MKKLKATKTFAIEGVEVPEGTILYKDNGSMFWVQEGGSHSFTDIMLSPYFSYLKTVVPEEYRVETLTECLKAIRNLVSDKASYLDARTVLVITTAIANLINGEHV